MYHLENKYSTIYVHGMGICKNPTGYTGINNYYYYYYYYYSTIWKIIKYFGC